MADDSRYYETFYGIDTDDWEINWGTLSSHHSILVKNFISEEASTTSNANWTSAGSVFIYPHNIKKTYFIEGVIEGQVAFISTSGISFVSDYRVSVIKISSSATETELATTGVISVNDSLDSTGDDLITYPFWIDVFSDPPKITENERLGIKIEWDIDNSSSVTAKLSHWNDSSYEDYFKMTIPFRF